jgi:hypothetical protein
MAGWIYKIFRLFEIQTSARETFQISVRFSLYPTDNSQPESSPESRQASMGIQVCSGPENCQVESTGVVLDFFGLNCGDPHNCYTVIKLFVSKCKLLVKNLIAILLCTI